MKLDNKNAYKCVCHCCCCCFFLLSSFDSEHLENLFFSSLSLVQAMSTILDKQSMLFIDTADMLARMSRESLVKAR